MKFAYLEVVLPSTEVQVEVWHQMVGSAVYNVWRCKVDHQVGKGGQT